MAAQVSWKKSNRSNGVGVGYQAGSAPVDLLVKCVAILIREGLLSVLQLSKSTPASVLI